MKFTDNFLSIRTRPDRAIIKDEWILRAIENPIAEATQQDGRIRRWARVEEMDSKYLRMVLLPDLNTAHNAFFDRRFKP